MAQIDGDAPRELFLIDGNSLAYRAFFALPESIATSDGRPTNAILGFASMLVKILTDYGEVPTVVVWDAGMSGRKEISSDYKAQRTTRPDLLKLQWPHLRPLVEAFGYRNISVEGFEADDVIAALVEQARERGIPVMVVTGDRDAYQLVGDGVRIMTTSRGITDTKVYDREGVIERYGIPPEKIPDFIGLKGDTSDNIPGVPGIGDKTASDLLQRFGDLETVLGSVDEISGAKRKENLTNHADDARVSKELASIQTDVPVDVDLEEFHAAEPDRSAIRETFRVFELRDPLRRLEEALGPDDAGGPAPSATTVETRAVKVAAAGLSQLDGQLAAFAAERPQPDDPAQGELLPAEPAAEPLRFAAYAGGDVMVGEAETLAAVSMGWGDRPLVAHDWKSIASPEEPCPTPPLEHDTLVAAYLLDPAGRAYPLEELLEREGIAVSVKNADGLAAQAVGTRVLAERQLERIEELGLTNLLRDVELPLVDVLIDMERTGVKLDVPRVVEISGRVAARIGALEREIWDLAGEEFTIGSPQQLSEILFNKLGLS